MMYSEDQLKARKESTNGTNSPVDTKFPESPKESTSNSSTTTQKHREMLETEETEIGRLCEKCDLGKLCPEKAFHYFWEDLFWRRKQEHIE